MAPTVSATFLEQTAEVWLRRLNSIVQLETTVEQPLKAAILDSARLERHFQINQSDLLSFTLKLFYTFSELRESHLLQ